MERAAFGRISHSQLNGAILLNIVFSSGAWLPSPYGGNKILWEMLEILNAFSLCFSSDFQVILENVSQECVQRQ